MPGSRDGKQGAYNSTCPGSDESTSHGKRWRNPRREHYVGFGYEREGIDECDLKGSSLQPVSPRAAVAAGDDQLSPSNRSGGTPPVGATDSTSVLWRASVQRGVGNPKNRPAFHKTTGSEWNVTQIKQILDQKNFPRCHRNGPVSPHKKISHPLLAFFFFFKKNAKKCVFFF